MVYAVLFFYAFFFIEAVYLFKLMGNIARILTLSNDSVKMMADKNRSDREKEVFMKKNSLTMLSTTFKFLFKLLTIIFSIYLLNLLIEQYDADLSGAVIEAAVTLHAIIIISLASIAYVWIRNVVSRKL